MWTWGSPLTCPVPNVQSSLQVQRYLQYLWFISGHTGNGKSFSILSTSWVEMLTGAETPAVRVRQPRSCGQGEVFQHSQYLMFGDVYRCRDTCSTCGTTQVVWAKGSPPTCWRSGASLQTGLCWPLFWCLSSNWTSRWAWLVGKGVGDCLTEHRHKKMVTPFHSQCNILVLFKKSCIK